MNLSSWIRSIFTTVANKQTRAKKSLKLNLEHLETRLVPYSVAGGAWPNPSLITISFIPDGTPLSSAVGAPVTSNLFSTFNAKFGSAAAWENIILKAAQVWAQQTNINFTVVPDDGAPSGSGSYEQGDPGYGDIRIGGYVFGNSTLANTCYPPQVNNYSIAGDVVFNTGQVFNIGSTYDLFTVATHEIGHALGLGESSAGTSSIEYPTYTGIKTALTSDDIAGIRNIYSNNGPRSGDGFDAGAQLADASQVAMDANGDVAASFAGQGVWRYQDGYGWTQLTTASVSQLAMSSSGDVVAVIPNAGVWRYETTLGWQQLTTANPTQLAIDAAGDVAIEISGAGVWRYKDGGGWTQLTTANADTLAMADGGSVAIDIPQAGMWRYQDSAGWQQLSAGQASSLAINAQGEVAAAISGAGVWRYQSGAWRQLTPTSAGPIAMDASGDVAAQLPGVGVWRYEDARGWQQLTPGNASAVAIGGNGFVAAELPWNGVWRYEDAGAWLQLTRTAGNNTAATAANLNSLINATSLTALAQNLNMATTSDVDWYTFTAPAGTTGTMTVQVQSQGLSLLTPTETVYAANGTTVLGNASGLNQYGTTLDVTVAGVSAGQKFYVKVQGADATAFSTGAYALALNFGTGTTPVQASPIRAVADGTPLTGGGGVADDRAVGDTYLDSVPVITGITPDNGISSADGITNTPNISFVGSAPGGNLVQVYLVVNNQLQYVGVTQANGQNQWSWTYTGAPLASGDYTFYAASVDAFAGIQSNLSSPCQVIINTSTPAAPTVSVNNPATGLPIVFSNVSTPVVAGTAAPNTVISVFVDGKLVAPSQQAYSTMSGSTGAWSFTLPSALGGGVHTVTATAMTTAGTTGPASAPYTFLVTTATLNSPVITGVAPAAGAGANLFSADVNSAQIKIAGIADAGAVVNLYQATGGPPQLIGTVTADNTGHWVFDYSHTTLAAGNYTFSATETTAAGASQSSPNFGATIDLTAPSKPVITGLAPTSTPGGNLPPVAPPSQVLDGTADPGVAIQVLLNSQQVGATTADNHGNWSFNFAGLSLKSGQNTFTAQAVDAAGNASAVSLTFTFTAAAAPANPVLTSFSPAYSGYAAGRIVSPTAGSVVASYTNSQTPTLFGTAPAGSYVEVFRNGGYVGYTIANSSGAWSYVSQGLQNGIYAFSAVALAPNGMSSPASNPLSIIVKTQAPNAPTFGGVTPDTGAAGDGITNSQQISLYGTADAGSAVTIYVGGTDASHLGTLLGTVTVNSAGNWTFDYTHTTLAAGTYSFTATETDVAGNVSQVSQKFAVTIDLTTPHTPVITGLAATQAPGGNLPPVGLPSQVLVGTADPADTVNVYLNSSQLVGTTTADEHGNWSFNFGSLPLQSNNTFTVHAVEIAGNQAVSALYAYALPQAPNAPQIQGFSPAYSGVNVGYTNSSKPTLTGVAASAAYVEVFQNGSYVGYVVAASNGAWSYSSPGLQDGPYTFTAVALSSNGLSSSLSQPLSLTVDTHAPNAPVITGFSPDTGVVGDHITASQMIYLTGTGDAGKTINVYKALGNAAPTLLGSVLVNSSGSWTFDNTHNTLAAGAYTFTATETDLAGNVSSASQGYAVTIDLTTPHTPVITGLAATQAPGGNLPPVAPPSQALVGTADPNDTLNVYINTKLVGTTTVGNNGAWSFAFGGLSLQSNNTLTVQAVEVAGNLSAVSAQYAYALPQAPNTPQIQGFSPAYSGVNAGYTNSSKPTLTGNAPSGAYVEVFQNGSYVGYVAAASNGAWSYTSPGLQDGPYTFTAVALSSNGLSSSLSQPLSLTVDTHAPNAPVITGFSPDTGVVGDHITASQKIYLTGTGDAGKTINVYQALGNANPVLMGSVVVPNSGVWTFDNTHTTLAAGAYTFTATETDLAGNASTASQGYAVTIDLTTPHTPVITGLAATQTPGGNLPPVAPPSQVLVGTADPNDTLNVYVNNQLVGTTTIGNNGAWSFAFGGLSLQNSNTFTVQSVEVAGNLSAVSAQYVYALPQTPNAPQIQSVSPLYNGGGVIYTVSQTPTLSGTAPAGVYVEVFQNGSYVGYTTAASNGSWTYTMQGLTNSAYTFTAQALSPNGLSGASSNAYSFTVNNQTPQAPTIVGITPDSGTAGDDVTNSQQIKIYGTAVAGVTVNLYQGATSSSPGVAIGSAVANGSGNWTFDYTNTALAAGSYVFTATATNFAGNTSQASQALTVTIDLTPPPAPVVTGIKNDSGVSSTDCITNVQGQVFLGTAIPNGSVQVFVDGHSIGSVTASGNGSWSFDYSKTNLNEGTHQITAQVTDYVGNVSSLSTPLIVVIDLTAPNRPVVSGFTPDTGVSSTDGITDNNTPTVFGTAEANSTVSLYNGNQLLGSTTASATGAWSISFTRALSDGTYSLQATATDAAGNTSQMSSTAVAMTIDTRIGNVQVKGISPDAGLHNNDGVTNVQNIMISGQSDANSTVQVFANGVLLGTTTANSQGNWTFDNTQNTMPQGTYQLTAVASDVAGNVSAVSQAYQVVIDTTPPAAPTIAGVSTSTDGSGNQILTLSGQADPQSQVTVYLAGSAIGTANADNQGNWNFNYHTTGHFANGTYLFTANAEDLAGNIGAQLSSFTLLLGNGMQNMSTPQLANASILVNGTNGGPDTAVAAPTFTGNAQAGTLVTVVDGDTVLGTAVANSQGHWTFTSPTLAQGQHNISVFATDSQGDEGLLSNNPLVFQI